jgi:hypothetical protein
MTHVYDNQFGTGNVYGHVFELVRRHSSGDGVHLDVGCGFGRIAEALQALPGLTYVGVDGDDAGLSSLASRGFEHHAHRLGDRERDLAFFREVLGDRPLRSVSIIDTLEHLEDPETVLSTLRELVAERGRVLVVSVPNVAHRDVGWKLAFGRFEYTPAGLLDRTHLRFFTDETLVTMARAVGLRQVDAHDVLLDSSDQRFPPGHLALAEESALRGLLLQLRGDSAESRCNQMVRAFVSAAPTGESYVQPHEQPARPFLSVVTRTQGRRLGTLREALLALSAQSVDDFEVVLVGHRLDAEARRAVERLVADFPASLRERVRLIAIEHGNRSTPLNAGFTDARGHYIAILDDDDVPLGHWVETFQGLAARTPGRVLRAVAVRQECDEVEPRLGSRSVRPTSGMLRDYPGEFDLLRHLAGNETPPIALAFPRSVFHDFGLRFDETLDTTEDWDFLMRAAFVCGVGCSDEVTGIYRWWSRAESSRTLHDKAEWLANHQRIWDKLDERYLILPPGSVGRLRTLLERRPRPAVQLLPVHSELLDALRSTGWRATAPIRIVGRALKQSMTIRVADVPFMTEAEAIAALRGVRASTSMRLADQLGRLGARLLPRR